MSDLRERVAVASNRLPSLIQEVSLGAESAEAFPTSQQDENNHRTLDEALSRLLLIQLQSLGFFNETTYSMRQWMQETSFPARYEPWLDESLAVLARRSLIVAITGGYKAASIENHDASIYWSEWDALATRCLSDRAISAQLKLVDVTIRALPAILTGKQAATDVLFPNSSMELVRGVYAHNPVADFFNRVLADAVINFVDALCRRDPNARIRILEIGAGTGGTTEGLLQGLRPFATTIAEYCYTDVSKGFLFHAQKTFGPANPFLTYKLFNVEEPLLPQHVDIGAYDIVIATNVLHATKNIRTTLRNAKAALKQNGLLFVNEMLGKSLFSHLTFGLLEGWWRYEDRALRVPGSPSLSPDTWRYAMHSEGFRKVTFPIDPDTSKGQQILIAESDGVIVQPDLITAKANQLAVQPASQSIESHRGFFRSNDAQVKKVIAEKVSEALQLDAGAIDPDGMFTDYGMDSILGVKAARAIGQAFAIELQTTSLFEYPTVTRLAEHVIAEHINTTGIDSGSPSSKDDNDRFASAWPKIEPAHSQHHLHSKNTSTDDSYDDPVDLLGGAGRVAANSERFDTRSVRCLRPVANAKSRLLIFYCFGFGESTLRWLQKLPNDIEVWGIGVTHIHNWDELVVVLASSIRGLFDRPVSAWGHSMGAITAFEVLSYLEKRDGVKATNLIASSSASPTLFARAKYSAPFYDIDTKMTDKEIEKHLLDNHVIVDRQVGIPLLSPDAIRNDVILVKSYEYSGSTISCPVVLVQANNDIIVRDPAVVLHWESVTSQCRYEEIDGTHLFFVNPPKRFIQMLGRGNGVDVEGDLTQGDRPIGVGIYKLKEMTAGSRDLHLFPLGTTPQGFLIYTADGGMAAHMWHPMRPGEIATPETATEQLLTYMAYGGDYEHQRNALDHRVVVDNTQRTVGKTLRRFLERRGAQLLLTTSPLVTINGNHEDYAAFHQLTWEPVSIENTVDMGALTGHWHLKRVDSLSSNHCFDEWAGRCIVTVEGVISILIGPSRAASFNYKSPFLSTNDEIGRTVDSTMSWLGRATSLIDGCLATETWVYQTALPIDFALLRFNRANNILSLEWRITSPSEAPDRLLRTEWELFTPNQICFASDTSTDSQSEPEQEWPAAGGNKTTNAVKTMSTTIETTIKSPKHSSKTTVDEFDLPTLVRFINRFGRFIDQIGGKAAPLTAENLLAEAKRKTRLTAFGTCEKEIDSELERLVRSLNEEADLTLMGRLSTKQILVGWLSNLLRAQACVAKHPEILRQPLTRPVFIAGLPRTGTTYLHGLLASDPDARAPLVWELLAPLQISSNDIRAQAKNVRNAKQFLGWVRRVNPLMQTIHNMEPEEPEECIWIIEEYWEYVRSNVESYTRWLLTQDLTPKYQRHRQFLQILQWQSPNRRWVLKTPFHTFAMDSILNVYPDACIVQTHRHPAAVIASFCSLIATSHHGFSQSVDTHKIGAMVSWMWETAVTRAMQVRATANPKNFYDVRYDDLVKEPLQVVRNLYQHFGFEFSPTAQQAAIAWSNSHPQAKFGVHRYALEQYGLDEAGINRRFKEYIERYQLA